MTSGDVGTGMLIPFTGGFENGYYLNLGWLFVPAVFFIVLGTDNGVNFTDGLDGLATGVTTMVAYFLLWYPSGLAAGLSQSRQRLPVHCWDFCYSTYIRHRYLWEIPDLWHSEVSWHAAVYAEDAVFILVVGLIYLVEVLSVMIQVTYFKKTGGKRFF